MSTALYVLVGIIIGAGLATTVYVRRIIRLDTELNVINTPARSTSVDALIESALGHRPLPRGSTINDIPRQGGRHRADDEDSVEESADVLPMVRPVQWPRAGEKGAH